MENTLIINKTNIAIFDEFNKYYERAFLICSILKKIKINIVNSEESLYKKASDFCSTDVFAFYLNKTEADASNTYVEILFNEYLSRKLGLTPQELLAGIAHEIGHVIFYFRDDKEECKEYEEFISDFYAHQIGLKIPLVSLLQKLVSFELYPKEQNESILLRIKHLIYYDNY